MSHFFYWCYPCQYLYGISSEVRSREGEEISLERFKVCVQYQKSVTTWMIFEMVIMGGETKRGVV